MKKIRYDHLRKMSSFFFRKESRLRSRIPEIVVLLVLGIIFLPHSSPALISPRAAGMGNTFISVADDHYTVFYNPAGIFSLAEGRIYLQYGESSEINSYGISYIFSPAEKIRVATSFFREKETQDIVLTYAGLISGFNWGANVRFSTLGPQYSVAWDLGFLYRWGPHQQFGILISDLSNTVVYDSLQVIPQQRKLGFCFPVSDTFLFSVDWDEKEGFISWGVEQYLSSYIFRFGYCRGDFTCGLGFHLGPLDADYAYLTRIVERGIVKENVHLLGLTLHF